MGNLRMRAEQINYGATSVKVALDSLDPGSLIDLNSRMNRIDAWKDTVNTEEKTGAYVEYNNALALNAVSVSADITASQDLHGYDKPWVGGYINKLPATVDAIKAANTAGTWSGNVYTISGVSFTINTDNGGNILNIAVIGTATASIEFKLCGWTASGISTNLPNGTYYIGSGCIANIYVNGAYNRTVSAAWVTISDTDKIGAVYAYISNGQTVDSTYYPMINMISATQAYVPYTNICPISGFSTVTITDVDAESHTATVTVALGSTVYGGSLDLTSGVLTVTHANIASYNGETIGEPWISSLDEYTQGGTPTTGAQVVYTLATPTTTTLTAAQLALVAGYNKLSANTGDITVKAYTGAAWGGDEA